MRCGYTNQLAVFRYRVVDLSLDNRIFLDSELDCALQELDLILNTSNTELLGDTSYGTEMESFLWTLTPMTAELDRYLREKLLTNSYYLKKFNVDININYMKGEYRSIYLVSITVTDTSSGQQKIRTYRFQ